MLILQNISIIMFNLETNNKKIKEKETKNNSY